MELTCRVEEITPLRVPRVYRVRGVCEGEVGEVEIELHEDVVSTPSKGDLMTVSITNSKETCLSHYFCAHGYVVSNTPIGEINRVIISLYGLLVILKSKKPLELKPPEHLYVGVTIRSPQ